MSKIHTCTLLQSELMGYDEAYLLQRRLIDIVRGNRQRSFLVLLQHRPVFTIGRRGTGNNILVSERILAKEGIEVREIDRGGDVTYHGPGQIVGYPIMALQKKRRDVHRYLRSLEAMLIRTAAHFGIDAGVQDGLTGVWVGPDKLASIGVGFTSWICYHGFALNVDPNMDHFSLINPCGFKDIRMTSVNKLCDRNVSVHEVEDKVIEEFAAEFEFDQIEPADISRFLEE